MLVRPRKRICPSVICVAFSKTRRHIGGLRNGSRPSATSISAQALKATSQNPTLAKGYFLTGVVDAAEGPRIALKKSLLGSTTMMSLLLRKDAR